MDIESLNIYAKKINCRILIKNLKKFNNCLRNRLRKELKNTSQSVFEDNFHSIERNVNMLLDGKSKFSVLVEKNSKLPFAANFIIQHFLENNKADTETAIEAINQLENHTYIGNTELSVLPWTLRYCLIAGITNTSDDKIFLKLLHFLNTLNKIDFEKINLKVNPIELCLASEHSDIYNKMAEETKADYRNKITKISEHLNENELETARKFVKKSNLSESHVGKIIFDNYEKIYKKTNSGLYIYLCFIVPFLFSAVVAFIFNLWWSIFLIYFPAFSFCKVFIDLLYAKHHYSSPLPKMNLNGTIPDNAKTLAVVCGLISSEKEITSLCKNLEKLYFTNRDKNIKFCLLGDLTSSDNEFENKDTELLDFLSESINSLNEKYNNSFCTIVRNRTYSYSSEKYEGKERKQGAITQLVNFIKGNHEIFRLFIGDEAFVRSVKYINVLDSDTQTQIDAICELVATALHPLNKPVINNERVTEGYAILVPQINTKLSTSSISLFTKIFSGFGGFDNYNSICSDFYQNLFSESIFTGKGLIDTDTFYEVMYGKIIDNTVLSHDSIESGYLRTGFVGTTAFSEGFPKNYISLAKRSHRWIRGDIQNIPYILRKKNNLNKLTKFKLSENIRNAIFPIVMLLLLIISLFLPIKASIITCISVFLAIETPYLVNIFNVAKAGGFFAINRKLFSPLFSAVSQLALRGFCDFILLPKTALMSLDATSKAIYRRFFSHKKVLEWVTASQADNGKNDLSLYIKQFLLSEIISIIFIIFGNVILTVYGFLFLIALPFIYYADLPGKDPQTSIKEHKKRQIISDVKSMWSYYRDFVDEQNNYLPPDNVQFAPVYNVAHRTSPTNIGLYLLSILAARDFDIISSSELFKYVDNTISTIENMKKYNGNLYNWYNTQTLETLAPDYVSTVDSGNFVCCLVALKEGLKEYDESNNLITRIEKIISQTDLSVFYNECVNLFCIGYDSYSKQYSENYYDLLMSEARLTSYFAIASRQVPKKHWKHLGRTMTKLHSYTGPVSWTGTMFEYFMPELLLGCKEGSFGYEALSYCLYCQKTRASEQKVPYGISESCYYSFDINLIYQYKAHGVQRIALKSDLDNETVISPYSTYITLPFSFDTAFSNLDKLRHLGIYGKYGFYEAVDFSKCRVGKSGMAVIKNYMAHHIGMSLIAADNAILGNKMQKRFMSDKLMASANELLDEKIVFTKNIYKNIPKKDDNTERYKSESKQVFSSFSPEAVKTNIISNGEYTGIYTDSGVSYSVYRGVDVFQKTNDLLRRPHGAFFAVCSKNKTIPFSSAPVYNDRFKRCTEFDDNSCNYFCNTKTLRLGMKIVVHSDIPCELRQFAIKNISSKEKDIILSCYLEPCLCKNEDFIAHPAFMQMFLKENFDTKNNVFIISRKERHSRKQTYMAIGFTDDINFYFSLQRENVLTSPDGTLSPFSQAKKEGHDLRSVPDPCVFINIPVKLEPHEQFECTMFICVASSKEELYEYIDKLRASKLKASDYSGPINNTVESRLCKRILPQIIYGKSDSPAHTNAVNTNNLNISSLWGLGISGDLPIVAINIQMPADKELAKYYVKAHSLLSSYGIKCDFVFIFDDKGEYSRQNFNALYGILSKETKLHLIKEKGGIHLVDVAGMDKQIQNLIYASAVHIAPKNLNSLKYKNENYSPINILPVKPQKSELGNNKVNCGFFNENTFVITKKPPTVWSTVLSNKSFGTLLSSNSLGFSWAINSHENKLTPWFNDTCTDNNGEMIIVRCGDKYYNIIQGSLAVFSPNSVVYKSEFADFSCVVTITVPQKGMKKNITVELHNNSKVHQDISIAYYIEPILGANQKSSQYIKTQIFENKLILNNPSNLSYCGYIALGTSEKNFGHITDRKTFFEGNWNKLSLLPSKIPCAAIIINKTMSANSNKKFQFVLSYGKTLSSVLKLNTIPLPAPEDYPIKITVETPDKSLNSLINTFLPCQIVKCRMFAKTGFYQNGGAYGFRDQLQDSVNALYINPNLTKQQILRSCCAQFEKGDVLHWWHVLENGGKKGVRTKCSDDYLWLVYAVCEYVKKTNDYSILDIPVNYIKANEIPDGEHEFYCEPQISELSETVYEHCIRAINYGKKFGIHGLPLIGNGDWNDGFNNIGLNGKGESVWLALFYSIILERFSEITKYYNQLDLAEEYTILSSLLKRNVEKNCWDGSWYVRAFFDDGKPLGSKECDACKIDILSQAFAVFANLCGKSRNNVALDSCLSKLVNEKYGIIKLFDEPFNENTVDAGYITSYPEGIRENAGQYTHAAVWLCIALFMQGRNNEAYHLIEMINPANKHKDKSTSEIYKNEPFYLSADVYSNPECIGRGGWSLYTGAAGWYYKAITEYLLGIKISDGKIYFSPSIPDSWNGFTAKIKYFSSEISLKVCRGENKGTFVNNKKIDFITPDNFSHNVTVIV